jgi:peptide/nickel transport system substrate-binding protein
MRRRALALLAAPCLLAMLACGKGERGLAPVPDLPPEQDKPAYGDILTSATIGDASNLIPMLASDSASHDIAGLVYSALLNYDGYYNLYGDLAERWEVSDDGLALTFHLRKGVKWRMFSSPTA